MTTDTRKAVERFRRQMAQARAKRGAEDPLETALCALVDHEAQIRRALTDHGFSDHALSDVCHVLREMLDGEPTP
jgi:SOS response regulatory protein OraA/RecX